MKTFYLDEFERRDAYFNFIKYMLIHSDKFSLVYFKYIKNESLSSCVTQIKKKLEPHKIFSCNTTRWPGTDTLNENQHIYKIFLYKSDVAAFDALSKTKGIFYWDYPRFPMDLCFYKNGYAWFELSAHSHYACILENDNKVIDELKSLGASLTYSGDMDDASLFLEWYLTGTT